MPYNSVSSAREDIPALENLSTEEVRQFIRIFNGLIDSGEEEGAAIPIAISRVKEMNKQEASSTPAEPSERRTGSSRNSRGSASGSGGNVSFSDSVVSSLRNKVKDHNEKNPDKKVTLGQLKAVYRRGAGAFSTSHHPNATRGSWAMGRVNSFLERRRGSGGHSQDDDLIKDLFSCVEYYDDECFSMLYKGSVADVTRDDKGNLVYRGEKFAGYGKPMRGSGGKQGKVLVRTGDNVEVVRFGDPSLRDNYSNDANDRFYARFGGRPQMDDKTSPLYWSSRWLWPRGSMKGKGAKPFYKLKT